MDTTYMNTANAVYGSWKSCTSHPLSHFHLVISLSSFPILHIFLCAGIPGMAGAGILFFFLFSLLIFLFLWDFSRPLMLTLLAWSIGLTITIVLKMIMTTVCK
jgi:hypothetical protein